MHTGDESDGSGDVPQTVWSAMPIYANETLYLGTPFYRILALDSAPGEELWPYDPETVLEALTQPALKCRGLACWEKAVDRSSIRETLNGKTDVTIQTWRQ